MNTTSALFIAVIIFSVLAVIGSLFAVYFYIIHRRTTTKEQSNTSSKTRRRFSLFKSAPDESKNPGCSSLDNSDMFFTILEHPPQPTTHIISSPQSPSSPTAAAAAVIDPISASLVRQSLEERAGYYKNPTRISSSATMIITENDSYQVW